MHERRMRGQPEVQAEAGGGLTMTWQPPTPDGPFGYLFHGSACQCEKCTQGEDEDDSACTQGFTCSCEDCNPR
jgi:hypothetical protein